MQKYKTLLTIGGLVLAVAGGLYLLSRPQARPASPEQKVLGSAHGEYDFGQISMAKGLVSHVYEIKNDTSSPLTLTKLYTSCMCTTASLRFGDKVLGPFGMPGHGALPQASFREELAPQESASVEVVFDPAAHGPAGLGKIAREVILETGEKSGEMMKFQFTVEVIP